MDSLSWSGSGSLIHAGQGSGGWFGGCGRTAPGGVGGGEDHGACGGNAGGAAVVHVGGACRPMPDAMVAVAVARAQAAHVARVPPPGANSRTAASIAMPDRTTLKLGPAQATPRFRPPRRCGGDRRRGAGNTRAVGDSATVVCLGGVVIRTLREQLLSTLIGHPEDRPDIPDGQALIG